MALLVLLPVLMIVLAWTQWQAEAWQHLSGELPRLLWYTLVLLVGVTVGSSLLGVGLAWLIAFCEFPGRRGLEWALMLPFAMPAYVLAFVWLGWLDVGGPVQQWWGTSASLTRFAYSPLSVCVVMSLVLYPYVYLLARSAFLQQGDSVMLAARSLGCRPWQAVLRVALPMARPAIMAGLALALMEALADFGAVAVFNYDTFTTAIYKTWFGLFNLTAAAQLASVLLLFVLLLLWWEESSRRQQRYYQGAKPMPRWHLRGASGWLATLAAGSVLALAFILPLLQLAYWSISSLAEEWDSRYWDLMWHSVALATGVALLTVGLAMGLTLAKRRHPGTGMRVLVRSATLGYALPGTVLAVALLFCLAGVQQWLYDSWGVRWLLVGSLFGLVLALVVRFMTGGFSALDARMQQIKPSIVEAARSLGCSGPRLWWQVYLPMLSPGVLTALVLVWVDVMKEMPATLLLRPFGWDTLAVRIFELTSEGEWQRAGLPGLTLVLVGILPVMLLIQRSHRRL